MIDLSDRAPLAPLARLLRAVSRRSGAMPMLLVGAAGSSVGRGGGKGLGGVDQHPLGYDSELPRGDRGGGQA